MKAAQIRQYGDPSVVEVVEIDQLMANDDQVLVEVYAASLNPFDTTVRSGNAQLANPLELPVTLGGDIAGKIIDVGQNVEGFTNGDTVYGQAAVVAGNSGAFAEFAATKSSQVAIAPQKLSFLEAASLPLVGVSALQALTTHIKLQSGQKLFIHGGAGGIGRIAIQIAKHLGAYVATTATGVDLEVVKNLGADEVIDYKAQHFADVLSGYDAVFDTVGGEDFTKSFGILRSGGKAVSMIARFDEDQAKEAGVTAMTQFTNVTTKKLNALRELVEAGAVKPQVGPIFQLDQVQEAFIARESGQASGKVIIEIIK